jgi:hypothetical protein
MSAQAELQSRADGKLIYDTDRDITWVADANLFKTLVDSSGNAGNYIQSIIEANGGIVNFHSSLDSNIWNLGAYDFDTSSGQLDWFGAKAWANSLVYEGFSDWRLPSITDLDYPGNYNLDTTTSELAHIYYDELGLKAAYDANGLQSNYGLFGNATTNGIDNTSFGQKSVGLIRNLQAYRYWSTEGMGNFNYPIGNANFFNFAYGNQEQIELFSDNKGYAWLVRSGDVVTVPAPGAAWLFATGLLGFIGLRFRGTGS